MTKQLFPLALGGLTIGTTEFVIMGILPDAANDLNITIPTAGHLISIYALGVVIGAPLLVALSSKFSPKSVLITFMSILVIFNAFSVIAPNYTSLLVSRFFAGLPQGAFFGVGTVVASKLAENGKAAKAIASMFTGLSVANLAMVPLTAFIGHNLHWRFAFGIVVLIGLITILFLYLWMPNLKSLKNVTFKKEMEFFKTLKAWHLLSIVIVGFGGLFAWLSYIAPLLIHVSNFKPSSVSYLMIIAGAGMVIGSKLIGYFTDKNDPVKVIVAILSLMIISLMLIFLFSENQIVSIIMTFICGVLSIAMVTPISMIMLTSAKHSEMLGAAFTQAAFNIANSIGAFAGGIPLVFGFSYSYPSLVGALIASFGLVLTLTYYKKYDNIKNLKQ